MNVPPIPQAQYFTMRLDILSNALKSLAEQNHQARYGLSVHEVRLLLLLREQPGLSLLALVRLSFMEKTKVSKMVSAMCRNGLIERRLDTADARQIALSLTPRGKRVALTAHRYVVQATQGLMDRLSPAQAQAFESALEGLITHVLHLQATGQQLAPAPPARRLTKPRTTPPKPRPAHAPG